MPASSKPEKRIQAEILLAYGALPWLRIWRNSTGVGMSLSGDAVVTFGLKGSADIIGIMEGGRFVAIEVKSKHGRQRPDQVRFQAMLERFGGLYILARSVGDVDEAFAAIGRRR